MRATGGGWRWRCQPSSAEIDNRGLVCVHTFAPSKLTRKKGGRKKRRKWRPVKRHHKSRGRSATPRDAHTPSCTYDPGRSEMAGCLSGPDPSSQGSHLPLSPAVRPSKVGSREKDAPEVFIGSFRGTKRRRCPPPCQASIRAWSSPLLRPAGRGHGRPCASSRGIKPPRGRRAAPFLLSPPFLRI